MRRCGVHKILIVDDDKAALDLLRAALSEAYTVIEKSNHRGTDHEEPSTPRLAVLGRMASEI